MKYINYEFLSEVANHRDKEIYLEEIQELPNHYTSRIKQTVINLTERTKYDPTWTYRTILIILHEYIIEIDLIRQDKIITKAKKDAQTLHYSPPTYLTQKERKLYEKILTRSIK